AADSAATPAIGDDVLDFVWRIAEAGQCRRNRGVDDLEIAAAGQLLELDQGEVRLNPGGVAIHNEADGARWGDHRDLGVAVAELLAQLEHTVAFFSSGFHQIPGTTLFV